MMCVRRSLFFFQAEDGIRDVAVTGVQTCALPICPLWPRKRVPPSRRGKTRPGSGQRVAERRPSRTRLRPSARQSARSEERRVGKEGGCGRSQDDYKKGERRWRDKGMHVRDTKL